MDAVAADWVGRGKSRCSLSALEWGQQGMNGSRQMGMQPEFFRPRKINTLPVTFAKRQHEKIPSFPVFVAGNHAFSFALHSKKASCPKNNRPLPACWAK
jgi:hypothetical protein